MPARRPSSVIAVSHWPRWATATLSLSAAEASAAPRPSTAASKMALGIFIANLPDCGRALLVGVPLEPQDWSEFASARKAPALHGGAHPADAPGHRPHDVHGEVRHLVDHEAEGARIDDGDLAILLPPCRRRAQRTVDHRHEADRLVLAAGLDHLVADHHLDHAGLDDIHALSGVAAVENDIADGETDGRARALGKDAHVDRLGVIVLEFAVQSPLPSGRRFRPVVRPDAISPPTPSIRRLARTATTRP